MTANHPRVVLLMEAGQRREEISALLTDLLRRLPSVSTVTVAPGTTIVVAEGASPGDHRSGLLPLLAAPGIRVIPIVRGGSGWGDLEAWTRLGVPFREFVCGRDVLQKALLDACLDSWQPSATARLLQASRRRYSAQLMPYLPALIALAANPVSVAEIARAVRITPGHLADVFRDVAGFRPKQMIDACFAIHVAWETSVGQTPLTAIAASAGFADVSQLSRHLRRRTGKNVAAWGSVDASTLLSSMEDLLDRMIHDAFGTSLTPSLGLQILS